MSRAENIPSLFQSDRVGGFVEQLNRAKSRDKGPIVASAMSYLTSHPSFVASAIPLLVKQRGNADAAYLLEQLQPQGIVTFLSEQGRLARHEDFTEVFEALNTSNDEIATAMFVGYVMRPTKALEHAKRDSGKQKEACLSANKVGLSLASALYDFDDAPRRKKALKLFKTAAVRPDVSTSTLVDILATNASYAQPKTEAAKADVIYFALNTLMGMDLDESIIRIYQDYIRKTTKVIDVGGDLWQIMPPGKQPNLLDMWKKLGVFSPKPHVHEFHLAVEGIQQQLVDFSKEMDKRGRKLFNLGLPPPLMLTLNATPPLSLGTQAVRKVFERTGTMVQQYIGDDYQIIEMPGDRLMYVSGDRSQLSDPEIYVAIANQLSARMNDEYFVKSGLLLKPSEVNTIIEYLNSLPINPEVVRRHIQELKPDIIGLYAFGKRGVSNRLNLPEEDFFQNMGMDYINFYQDKQGTRVEIKFKKNSFSFYLNQAFEPIGLEQLSPENRDWLHMTTLSYMRALRNQDKFQVEYTAPDRDVDSEYGPEGEDEETGKKTKGVRTPHLRVMDHRRVAWAQNKDTTNQEVQELWKINLLDLNKLLRSIQSDRRQLTDPNSDVNKWLATHPYGISIKHTLDKIVQRIMNKKTRPQWKRVGPHGEEMLVPTIVDDKYNMEKNIYMVTFVPESFDKHARPHQTRSHGVAEELKRLSNKR